MSDDDRLSDVDRRSLRILARSSKAAASGTRLSERLERAADSGLIQDYQKAEQTFDSLPAEDRVRIGIAAEKHAETERVLTERRRNGSSSVAAQGRALPPPAADDAPLQWNPIFQQTEAQAPQPPATPKRPHKKRAPEADEELGTTWKLGNIPGNPKMPTVGRVPKAPTVKPAPPKNDDWDDDHKDWNWREIPEDPVLNRGRKKTAVDPVEELRRQMLGLDAKYGKR